MAKVDIPQGGYDANTTYRQISIKETETVMVGDHPHGSYRQYRIPKPRERPWELVDTTKGPMIPYSDAFTTMYAHQQGMTLWHSDHIEIDDTIPEIIDYGWKVGYITTVWTANEVERGDIAP